jgi:intraflagellar transport protein 20
MQEAEVDITFDEDNRIRVMPKEKYKATEALDQQCQEFTEKIKAFGGTVQMLVDLLDNEAQKIEYEKLRAIGQRNRAMMEEDARKS